MRFKLTPLQSKALAAGLAVLTVFLVFHLTVGPLLGRYQENQAAIEQLKEHINRYQVVAATRESVQLEVESMDRTWATEGLTLPQDSPTLAAAALQERVKDVVSRNGGKLISTQILPADEQPPFVKVSVSVRVSAKGEAVQPILHGLEASLPYLIVDEVVVSSRIRRAPRRKVTLKSPLDIRFQLSGFMRPGEA